MINITGPNSENKWNHSLVSPILLYFCTSCLIGLFLRISKSSNFCYYIYTEGLKSSTQIFLRASANGAIIYEIKEGEYRSTGV